MVFKSYLNNLSTRAMTPIIETTALSHRFGSHQAVDRLDLHVPGGAVYGFLGPNGSGKTTTIRLLLGLLRPQQGRIAIFGETFPAARQAVARRIGAMVETPCFYGHLSGFDNLELTRRALGLNTTETARVLDLVELAPFARQRVAGYSLGMRQRLGIARALLGHPKLLILDEPTNGLDPAGVLAMRQLIRSLPEREGASVFVSSHLLNEIEQMASHVGLMDRGRLIAQSTLAEFVASGGRTIEIGVRDACAALDRLKSAGVDATTCGAERVDVAVTATTPPAALLNTLLVADGFDVFALQTRTSSLEEIFLRCTTEDRRCSL